MPLGLGTLSNRRRSSPLAFRRNTRPGRIGDAGLALIGEIEVAVGGEVQVVQALEAFAVGRAQHVLELAGLRRRA